MKMASWGYCVLVIDSSGEPASRPGDAFCLCSGWIRKWNCCWACNILRRGAHQCAEFSHRFCVKFVAKFALYLATLWTMLYICYFYKCWGSCFRFFWGWWISQPNLSPGANLDADVQLWHDVCFLLLVVTQYLLLEVAVSAVESCWRRRLLRLCITSEKDYFSSVPRLFLFSCGFCFRPFQYGSCCDPY